MNKLKYWLCEKYLPDWCRRELLDENERLKEIVRKRDDEIENLNQYIAGMERALKLGRKIIIQAERGRDNGKA